MTQTCPQDQQLKAYLARLGDRVRQARARRGMARRVLARDSGVSERYLAQLENGYGNPTVTVLRQIAEAVDYPLEELVSARESSQGPDNLTAVTARLQQFSAHELTRILGLIDSLEQGRNISPAKQKRIALIGLRGGGKTTLGRAVSEKLNLPFVEVNRLAERDYGGSVGEILALSGQSAFRRLERRALETIIKEYESAIISAGGGIVSETGTFQFLLCHCHTIWIKASPEEHMNRVIAQGDLRPMAKNDEAMEDLKAILAAREPAYRQADHILNTSGKTLETSLDALYEVAQKLLKQETPALAEG